MTEPGAVTRALLRMMHAADVDDAGEAGLAERICLACVHDLDVDGAALSLLTGSTARETLWATDRTAEILEDLQFSLNEGACMEAAATGRPVIVPDLHHATETARWPVFAAAVAERTLVAALFALPLQWGAVNLGVLDLYRVTPGGLGDAQRRDVLGAVDVAAMLLLGRRTTPGGGADRLDRSVSHRAEVHQATGMVVAQLDVDAVDALARLRACAFAEGRLLLDVARDVVGRRLVFTEDGA